MIVLDASAVVCLLLNTPPGQASGIRRRVVEVGGPIYVPHLADVEVAQVLRRFVLRGELSSARAGMALTALRALPLVRYPHSPFLPRVWALRDNLTAYDGVYVALAEALAAPLLTLHARIQRAPGLQTRVDVV